MARDVSVLHFDTLGPCRTMFPSSTAFRSCPRACDGAEWIPRERRSLRAILAGRGITHRETLFDYAIRTELEPHFDLYHGDVLRARMP